MKKASAVTNPPSKYWKLSIMSPTIAPSFQCKYVQPWFIQLEIWVTEGESKQCALEHKKPR